MSHLEDFAQFLEYAKQYRLPTPRRYLRDFSNPFEKYSPLEFYERYQFTPDSIKNVILPMLVPDLMKPNKRGLPFPPEIMVLLTLRYYATGKFQKLEGDSMNICQQSVSRIILKVTKLIASKMRYFVKFPTSAEGVTKLKQKFYEVAYFPGVIGCINCTHIKIKNPGGTLSDLYKNTKGWFSINVQAVTGPNLEFFDIVARWPGSTHNSFIFNNSTVKQRLESGQLDGILLGSNAYAVSNVLLTPFLSPNNSSEENYNKSHIKTRNTVERAFGVWKTKFRCLQVGMGIKVDTVVAVICACATLHNISLLVDDNTINSVSDDDEIIKIDEITDEVKIVPMQDDENSDGFLLRQSLVDNFFKNY